MIITDNNFETTINSHKLVMVDFWSEGCKPCKMFSPILDEVAVETGIWLGKINVDENQQKSAEYNINAVPTTILFKDGKQVKTIVGAKPKHILIEEIKEWI